MRYVLLSGLATAMLTFTAGTAGAADPVDGADVDIQAGPVQVQVDADRRGPADRPDVATKDYTMRLSELNGLAVRNAADEDLGEIYDIVIDMRTGKVRYAALATGGFLGLGEKLLAVPFHAFQFQEKDDEKFFVLNVDNERLKQAPGFDSDHWPARGDKVWIDSDAYYPSDNRAEPNRRLIRPRQ